MYVVLVRRAWSYQMKSLTAVADNAILVGLETVRTFNSKQPLRLEDHNLEPVAAPRHGAHSRFLKNCRKCRATDGDDALLFLEPSSIELRRRLCLQAKT